MDSPQVLREEGGFSFLCYLTDACGLAVRVFEHGVLVATCCFLGYDDRLNDLDPQFDIDWTSQHLRFTDEVRYQLKATVKLWRAENPGILPLLEPFTS